MLLINITIVKSFDLEIIFIHLQVVSLCCNPRNLLDFLLHFTLPAV